MSKLDRVLKATYVAQDVAFALQLPPNEFADVRRDMTRHNVRVFPRKASPGPGGGEWRYPHIVEMALYLASGQRLSKLLIRSMVWGLARLLNGNDLGCAKINAIPQDARNAIFFGGSEWDENDFPVGVPHEFTRLVDFPVIYFDEDFISRNPAAPAFLLYDQHAHENGPADCRLIGDMTLMNARKAYIEMLAPSAGSEKVLEIIVERADDVAVINLTTMLARIDERLSLRLTAREIRGF